MEWVIYKSCVLLLERRNYRSSRSEVFSNFIKKETVNLSNILKTPIFIEHLRWLLLELIKLISTLVELQAL